MIKKIAAQLTILLFSAIVLVPVSFAQDTAGLTIIPPKFELFANPGDTVTETIRIRNDTNSVQSYGILVEDFSSSGEEGGVVLEEGENDNNYSLKRWIEPSSQNLVLQPNEEKTFPYTIKVPKDAEPGGHYASILFQIGGGSTQEGVTSVQHRVGSLVLLRISGNVVEKAIVESFDAPTYSQKGPVKFNLRIKNEGTTHIQPKGTIIITNIFNQKVDEIPLNGQNVFPGSIRKMDTEWNKESLMGYYTATLVASYGQENLPMTGATRFAVISPITAILLTVGVIAGSIFLLSLFTGRSRIMKALKVLTSGK